MARRDKTSKATKGRINNMVNIEEVKYGDFGNCVRIFNETTEVLVTTDIGPRIIKYALIGSPNVFCEHFTKEATNKETGWKMYGGHRLWHAPEDTIRTYQPDNEKFEYTEIENGIQITCEKEEATNLQKNLIIIMSDDTTEVAVIHAIANRGLWPVEYSVWALSVMAAGGVEVIPTNQEDTGLLHNRSISLWAYTKMNDPRVFWGEKYITLKQDAKQEGAFKLGITNNLGWAAYFNNNQAFVKRYAHYKGEQYPDNGVSFETYTNDFMLEIESLSPLVSVNPRELIEHMEIWTITPDIKAPENTEESIQKAVDALNIPEPLIGGGDCGCGEDHDHGDHDCGCGDDCDCDHDNNEDNGCGCGC